MAEIKRTFHSARMNKDLDDRILPPGEYRDALNVSVDFSEDGNVGAMENLKGNEVLGGAASSVEDLLYIDNNPQDNVSYIQITASNIANGDINLSNLTAASDTHIKLHFGGDSDAEKTARANAWRSSVGWPDAAATFDEQQTISEPITFTLLFNAGQFLTVVQPAGNIPQNISNTINIGNPTPNPIFSPQTGGQLTFLSGSGEILPWSNLPNEPAYGEGAYLRMDSVGSSITTESYLDPAKNIGVTVIGTCVDEENDKIYYLFTGSTTDGIVEYCNQTNTLSPILLDGDVGVVEVAVPTFAFADANAAATVDQGGNVFVQAEFGVITSLTNSFNTYVTAPTPRQISAKVKVPGGYTNSNSFVEGTLTATQPALGLPDVYIEPITNITDTTVTFNARFASNPNLTAIGFKYLVNSGGTQTVDIYSNSFAAGANEIYGNTITMYNPDTQQIYLEGVPGSDFDVLDSTNTIISSSNYDVTTFESGRPTNVTFNDDYNINDNNNYSIVQTSSLSTINNAISESDLQSTGTNISVTPISSPFKTNVTGLTPDTDYVLLAYATNSSGTTYSNVINFKTNVASISLPTFTNSTASAGTSLVVIGATPQLNGGDTGATLYVVSSQGSSTSVSDYKTSAYTLMAGGSASGFELHTIGSWSSGVAQSVSIVTTGGSTRKGLVFAKNSSPLQNGSDTAGYAFDTALVSATANSPNVNGAASFSGSIVGPTGTKTAGQSLSWSVSGTSTVTTVPVGGHYGMHSDVIKTGGSGSAWYPGNNWATAPNASSLGATSSWSHSETTTAPTTPGTYSWSTRLYYDSNTQSNGTATGSFTIPTPPPATNGTIVLTSFFIMGPNVGAAFGGSNGNLLNFVGSAPNGWTTGTNVTLTFGGSTNVIQLSAVSASGSNTNVSWVLVSGGGTAASSGSSVAWSI